MSDLGFLSAKRERQLARILDASIDFDKLLKDKKKFLGIINIGSVLERNDRTLFRTLISYLDDNILGDNATKEQQAEIDKSITLLESHDIAGFIDYVAGIVSEEVNLPIVGKNKQLFILVLQLMSEIISKAVERIEELNAKAEQESAD